MDCDLLMTRLGHQIRAKRVNRGLTQAQLAALAGLTRQKVIAVEKGTLTVSMMAYARVVGALDCEFTVTPAILPTLEELGDLFE